MLVSINSLFTVLHYECSITKRVRNYLIVEILWELGSLKSTNPWSLMRKQSKEGSSSLISSSLSVTNLTLLKHLMTVWIMKSIIITENLKKLMKGSADEHGLSCINGIKAFSMLFILAGHALVFVFSGPVHNSSFYYKASHLVQNAFLLNSPLFVDSFLLLSGFLFARLLLLELDKRNGKVNFILLYIFRYIRWVVNNFVRNAFTIIRIKR